MNYREIEPARAKRVSDKKLADIWGSVQWFAEEKLDGWRYLLHFGRDLARPYLTGRRISLETGIFSEKGLQVPHIWPNKMDQLRLDYTVLDGEIYPPEGASFRDIAGIMNSDPDTAAKRVAKIGPPTYRVFDILFCNGLDCRDQMLMERHLNLQAILAGLNHPLIQIVPQEPPSREIYEQIIARGGEGVILKDVASSYGDGWIKVKREHTLDVVLTGFTEAKFGRTGKFHRQIGAAQVSVYLSTGELVEIGQCSGMDDATRRHMTDHKSEWIGTVVEISAQEFAKDRLRHPRYVRPRPDASPAECTFDKMMRDLGGEDKKCEEDKQLRLL